MKESGTERHKKCVELPKTEFRKYKYNKNTKQTLDTIGYKETFLCERERSRQTPEMCGASQNLISEIQIQIQTHIQVQNKLQIQIQTNLSM